MCNSKFTKIFNSINELLEEPTSFLLRQVVFRSDVVEDFSVAAVLHDEEQSLRCFDDFIQLNDGRVSHNLKDVNFSFNSFDVVDVLDFSLVQNFDGDLHSCEDVETLFDFTESALA